ncbi:hypothetical protein ACVXHM_33725 [Pseudomonas aeruginosa]|nr:MULTISPECIES: hypothetical protein [Pseudomonas]MCR7874382.1 hypothetical protein [Pseudomonas aeruginosa]UTN35986.1 hypothetical protein MMZ75_34210 [Pseudomonas aeruginosa]
MSSEPLSMWTVYETPLDYPNHFVARRWLAGSALVATKDVLIADDLAALRGKLPQGLHCLPAIPGDAPSIIETWV